MVYLYIIFNSKDQVNMDLGINWFEYEYKSVWAKVISYDDMRKDLKTDLEMIIELIEIINLNHSPESWCGSFQLEKDEWKLSSGEHCSIANEIIEACSFF